MSTVELTAPSASVVEVVRDPAPSVVQVVAQGPQGPQGPAGPSAIGGFPISVSGLASGDLLQFGGSAWINTGQENVTDGGNF